MEVILQKCLGIETVDSFCDCIAGEEPADPAAKAFCNRAKTDKNVTDEDLAELKMALADDDACCDC